MQMNFRTQCPPVSNLLRFAAELMLRLPTTDQLRLADVLRPFETVSAPMVLGTEDMNDAPGATQLSKAERRMVIDRMAEQYEVSADVWRLLDDLKREAVSTRPCPGSMQVIDVGINHASGFFVVRHTETGSFEVMEWRAGKPLMPATFPTYFEARDEVDALLPAHIRWRQDRVDATGKLAVILVPKVGSMAEKTIIDGSGIVGVARGDRTTVYYEGNLNGASNLERYSERLVCAAGRLFKTYPTIAMTSYDQEAMNENFVAVGVVTDDYRVLIDDATTVIGYAAKPSNTVQRVSGGSVCRQQDGQWIDEAGKVILRDALRAEGLVNTQDLLKAI